MTSSYSHGQPFGAAPNAGPGGQPLGGTYASREASTPPQFGHQAQPMDERRSFIPQAQDPHGPRFVTTRVYAALLESAASESASRRRAMKAATDNADELIKKYKRIANQARQAGITQEISEIVGGVNALADAQAGSE